MEENKNNQDVTDQVKMEIDVIGAELTEAINTLRVYGTSNHLSMLILMKNMRNIVAHSVKALDMCEKITKEKHN